MPNRLASESSPYLLQHADNPVDWYPWGKEALERAHAEDKPILLSIGYAACHWCHVMAHESFEDADTAAVMNEHFVNVKVDREERPDIDGVYMMAVQAMTGQGGWPMTVFLTPSGDPFYGGTYFPPDERHGLPSFTKILQSVSEAYRSQREAIDQSAAQLKQIYKPPPASTKAEEVTPHMLEIAFRNVSQHYDPRYGGFDGAPKFPQTMALDFLLRYGVRTGSSSAQTMVLDSFRKMARGGIYDQIGGGFARYAVDEMWLVPHFEKMLYDNALLVRLGVHLWQATRDQEVRRVTEETLGWVLREMTSPEGGFYSSLDADSEGHEGKFYVWDESELDSLLGKDAALVKAHYGVTPGGNFEGKSILFVQSGPSATAARLGVSESEVSDALARARNALLEARSRRVRPGRDEKILTGWNGLMLRAVADAARAFDSAAYREMAVRNAEYLTRTVLRDGRVMRSTKDGFARIPGYLEDHAALALGFLSVYELTYDEVWVKRALELARSIERVFWDDDHRIFFDTASDAETLITRPREVADNAVPAANSLAADLFLHLADLTDDDKLRGKAERVLRPLAVGMMKHAPAFGYLLGVAETLVFGGIQVAIAGPDGDADVGLLSRVVAETYIPGLVLAGGDPRKAKTATLLRRRELVHESAAAHVCRQFTCVLPTADREVLTSQLAEAVRVRDTVAAG